MSRPDLCRAISSRRKSLSRRCRFSMASSTVNRGRTPRNSATSPRHGLRSRIAVGRFVSRASSTAQFTATVVVPAPPFAPRNTCVTHGGLAPAVAASRRAAVRRTAPWNDSSIARDACVAPPGFHGKNSFAPARIAWRIRSGSAAAAMAKIATVGCPARSRSMAAMPDEASARMSTTTTSGPAVSLPACALDDADRDAARAQKRCDLPLEFVVVTDDGCRELCHGCLLNQSNRFGKRRVRRGTGPLSQIRRCGVMRPLTLLPCICSMKKPDPVRGLQDRRCGRSACRSRSRPGSKSGIATTRGLWLPCAAHDLLALTVSQ